MLAHNISKWRNSIDGETPEYLCLDHNLKLLGFIKKKRFVLLRRGLRHMIKAVFIWLVAQGNLLLDYGLFRNCNVSTHLF